MIVLYYKVELRRGGQLYRCFGNTHVDLVVTFSLSLFQADL